MQGDTTSPQGDTLPLQNDVSRQLEWLRAHVRNTHPDPLLDHSLSHVSEAIERITVEHAGMAQELLGVYEQLGVVFEVTKRLTGIQSEAEMIDLVADSFRRSFAQHECTIVYPGKETPPPCKGTPFPRGQGGSRNAWIESLIKRCRDQACVVVERAPDDLSPPVGFKGERLTEVMVAPVWAGDPLAGGQSPLQGGGAPFVCAIVLTGSSQAGPFCASDMLLLESLTKFCGDLIRNHRLVHELHDMSLNVVRALVNAVDQKDEYTCGHSLRVGYYSTLLGQALSLNEADLEMLQWSALLHDVGKIGIRDDVLKKQAKLTDEEFNHIKEHPVRSHKVVQEVPQLARALDGVLHHHEHYDGTGYPSGLSGSAIPRQARIIQIADVFDALTSDRSYRSAFPWQKALQILQDEGGTTVDPHLAEVFDGLMHKTLGESPDAWDEMVRRADRFTLDCSSGVPKGYTLDGDTAPLQGDIPDQGNPTKGQLT